MGIGFALLPTMTLGSCGAAVVAAWAMLGATGCTFSTGVDPLGDGDAGDGVAISGASAPAAAGLGAGSVPAHLVLDPPELLFGASVIGDAVAAQGMLVTNVGERTTQPLSAHLVAGGAFAVGYDGCTGTLEPGDSCEVVVEFSPGVPGDHAASLSVVDGDRVVSARLSGQAATPPTHVLVVDSWGSGWGWIDGGGDIECDEGRRCEFELIEGTEVTLEAHGSFESWSGDCGGFGDCSLTMQGNRSVVGWFQVGN